MTSACYGRSAPASATATAAKTIIANLAWTGAPSRLDLRGTGLTGLSVTGTIELLQLPDALASLTLLDGARVQTATAADDGRWLDLHIAGPSPGAHIPAGLDQVRSLRHIGQATISAAPLPALRHLQTLWLAWQNPPGTLTDAAALVELPELAHLTLSDAGCRPASTSTTSGTPGTTLPQQRAPAPGS